MTSADTIRCGRRVIRPGDVVKISGERGAEFRVTRVDPERDEIEAWGGPGSGVRRKAKIRTFPADRIGTRLALAGTEEAEKWA